MEERLPWEQEAAGSRPVTSTILLLKSVKTKQYHSSKGAIIMNAVEIKPEMKLEIVATAKDIESKDGSINVKMTSTCPHVAEELSLLETATFTFFLKRLGRVVPEERESVIEQYLSNIDRQLHNALNANNHK